MSLGANVVIANAMGRKDQETVSRAVHTSILFSFLAGFAVMLIGEILAEVLTIHGRNTYEVSKQSGN